MKLQRLDNATAYTPCEPVWPLPRRQGGPSNQQLQELFGRYEQWHYAFAFKGGFAWPCRHWRTDCHSECPQRPLQRFKHLFPPLLRAAGGSLRGLRVLDAGCNAGFWTIQCALLGAEQVVGFDARQDVIEQARLIQDITGITNVEFRTLDIDQMTPGQLGGPFDVVLYLGLLYHLAEPLTALRMLRAMSRRLILLDTAVVPGRQAQLHLRWENAKDVRMAAEPGIVAYPTRSALELLFRQTGFRRWGELPIRSNDLPGDYLSGRRACFLIEVSGSG